MSGRDPPAALGGSARAAGGDKPVCNRYAGKVNANVSPEERRHGRAERKIPLSDICNDERRHNSLKTGAGRRDAEGGRSSTEVKFHHQSLWHHIYPEPMSKRRGRKGRSTNTRLPSSAGLRRRLGTQTSKLGVQTLHTPSTDELKESRKN